MLLLQLNDAPLAIVDKRRSAHNVSEVMNLIGDVKGKVAVLVDDMIDTAGTITNAAKVTLLPLHHLAAAINAYLPIFSEIPNMVSSPDCLLSLSVKTQSVAAHVHVPCMHSNCRSCKRRRFMQHCTSNHCQ